MNQFPLAMIRPRVRCKPRPAPSPSPLLPSGLWPMTTTGSEGDQYILETRKAKGSMKANAHTHSSLTAPCKPGGTLKKLAHLLARIQHLRPA